MGVYFNPHDTVKKESVNDPIAALQWILRNVPCFKGKIPADWTDGAILRLLELKVPMAIVIEAFKIARSLKYDWYETALVRSWKLPAYLPPAPSLTQQEPMTPEYVGRMAALLEQKYILAVNTDDYKTQASIITAFKAFFRRVLLAWATGEEPDDIKRRQRAGRLLQSGAPTLTTDNDKLERQGIPKPTEQDMRTKVAPTRPRNQRPKPRK